MAAIQIADLNNGKVDVDHVAKFANSTELTATDRMGRTKRTLAGIDAEAISRMGANDLDALARMDAHDLDALTRMDEHDVDAVARMDANDLAALEQRQVIEVDAYAMIRALGYQVPVPYAAGLSMTTPSQTVSYLGQTYAPIDSEIPFVTSGTFEVAKFRLIQGVSGADLAAAAGLPAYAFTASEVQAIMDNAFPLQDYTALRAYGGRAKSIQVTGLYTLAQPDGIAGPFRRVDTDTTSVDNGGTIIVDVLGRRWYRITDAVTFGHFGAVGNNIADDTIPIRNAVNYALTNVCDMHGVGGRTYRITGEIDFPKKHVGVIREYITFDGHGCKIRLDGSGFTGFGFTKTGAGMFDGANYYLIFKNFNFTSVAGNGCIAIRPAGFITSQYVGLHFAEVDYPFWAQKADSRGTPDYVQSPRIIECYSVHHQRFFTAPRVYDFVMDNTFIDAAVDGILVDFGPAGQSAYGMRITNSAIQSQSGVGVSVGGAQGLIIEGNYWENCGREFVALHSGTTVNYGGSIQHNFIQPKGSPPPERLAAFDLGGCSSSGFKLGGNVAQDQNLFNFSSAALGYFDTTNDRSAMPPSRLYNPTVRPSTVRAIFNDGARWGLLWGTSGGMVLNTLARGIEYTHPDYDYLDPVDNLRIPIVRGVAFIAPPGFGGGLDGLGVFPSQAPSLYPQKAWARGSYLANPTPSELGAAGSKYVVHGWTCTVAGRAGTWVQCRSLTGN